MLAGRYRLEGTLGGGGQGQVLAAIDTWEGDRPVAIKRVLGVQALTKEFAVLRQLRHRALVQAVDLVVDPGEHSAAAYLVEERIEGQPVLDWARSQTAEARAAVLAPIAQALAHLHARGWVHLDPSPLNILVRDERDGYQGVLIDLGLARPMGERGAAGTGGCVAPELLEGEPARGAADIYTLGVTLAVINGAPFPQVGQRVRLDGLPPQVRSLVERCTAVEPASRLDAVALAHGLCSLAQEDPRRLLRPEPVVPMCGREAELEAYRRWWGNGAGVLRVCGPTGVGKSTLLSAFADEARLEGAVVLRLAGDDRDLARRLLSQVAASLGEAATTAVDTSALTSAEHRGEQLVLRLDDLVGARRVVAFIDDADLLPEDVAHAVEVWQARPAGSSFRVVLAHREPSCNASTSGGALLVPGPLNDEAVQEILQLAYGEPRAASEADRLIELCGRYPGGVTAGLAALTRTGDDIFTLSPKAVRWAERSPLPRALWPLTLVRGPLEEPVLRALLAGDTTDVVVAGLRTGCLERLDNHGATPLYRVPEAWRRTVSGGAWEQEAHRRLAVAFDEHGAPLQAAAHWAQASESSLALERLQNADQAPPAHLFAAMEAVADAMGPAALGPRLLRRWLVLAEEAADLNAVRRAGSALAEHGDAQAGQLALARAQISRAHYDDALSTVEPVPPSSERAAVVARACFFKGQVQRARSVAEEGLAEAAGLARLDLLNILGHCEFAAGEHGAAVNHLTQAVAEAASDPRELERAQQSLAVVLHRTGELQGALPLYRSTRARAQGLSWVRRTLNLATALQDAGDLREARLLYREAHGRALALANRRERARVGVNLANLEVLLGEIALGARVAEDTVRVAREIKWTHAAGMAALVATEAAIERGSLEDSEQWLQTAQELLAEVEDPVAAAEVELLQARREALRGRVETALEHLNRRGSAKVAHIQRRRAFLRAYLGAIPGGTADEDAVTAAAAALRQAQEQQDRELAWRAAVVRFRLAERRGVPEAPQLRSQAEEALSNWRNRLEPELQEAYFSTHSRRQLLRWLGGASRSMFFSATPLDTRHLKRLVAINRRLAREQSVQLLLELVVDNAIELLGAERGFILQEGEGGLEVAVARNFERQSLEGGTHRVSRSIAQSVMQTGEAVLTTNAQEDERFSGIQSVAALRIRSVVCVPLRGTARDEDPVTGALYLDHRFQERAFKEPDVELAEAFADQAAIALENARLLEQTRQQEGRLQAQNRQLERYNAQLQREAAHAAEEAEAALRRLREEGPTVGVGRGFERFVGRSDGLRQALRLIDRFADTDVPVFVHGESGTGKELVARAIHERSRRVNKPFVSINCGAVPNELIESELFGYKRGAFTGAVRDKAGLVAAAQGGTLFLDEVGEMPTAMQVKLLRVLQEREYRPVGATQTVPADFRVVSASLADLEQRVKEGTFREDLYYRLVVVAVTMPPLRERREDIPLLVDHFCRNERSQSAQALFTQGALGCFLAYDWPGNVRELENEVRRALALADDRVRETDLSEKLQGMRKGGASALAGLSRGSLKDIMSGFEREVLLATLERTGWNVRQAAKELGLSRAAMYTRLNRLGIERDKG